MCLLGYIVYGVRLSTKILIVQGKPKNGPACHPVLGTGLARGDAIIFHSEKCHNVATVKRGTRNSLVLELWRGPTNQMTRFCWCGAHLACADNLQSIFARHSWPLGPKGCEVLFGRQHTCQDASSWCSGLKRFQSRILKLAMGPACNFSVTLQSLISLIVWGLHDDLLTLASIVYTWSALLAVLCAAQR